MKYIEQDRGFKSSSPEGCRMAKFTKFICSRSVVTSWAVIRSRRKRQWKVAWCGANQVFCRRGSSWYNSKTWNQQLVISAGISLRPSLEDMRQRIPASNFSWRPKDAPMRTSFDVLSILVKIIMFKTKDYIDYSYNYFLSCIEAKLNKK